MAELSLSCVSALGTGYAHFADRTGALLVDDERAEAIEGPLERGTDTLRVGGAVAGYSQVGAQVELRSEEATVSATPVEVSVEGPGAFHVDGPGILWELDPDGAAAIRTIWAGIEEGGLLLLAAIRPSEGSSHAEERILCARLLGADEAITYSQPLLSTEYDAAGAHTRATLELWSASEGVADRGAGTRERGGRAATAAGEVEAARFAWRIGGSPGFGAYEILTL